MIMVISTFKNFHTGRFKEKTTKINKSIGTSASWLNKMLFLGDNWNIQPWLNILIKINDNGVSLSPSSAPHILISEILVEKNSTKIFAANFVAKFFMSVFREIIFNQDLFFFI